MKRRLIRAADLFCGAGGASTGLLRAAKELGLDVDLLAINHWTTAVQTHSLNHPGVRHLCESIERVNPLEVVRGGHLDLLLAGPECTHHSTARGGRPVNEQSRASAWHILKWAQELYIGTILIENVPEFRTWGPIGANKRPLKSKKGLTYRAFLDALRSLDYKVEEKILVAADYGDPTTRQRLFILARRGRLKVRWPSPTHSKTGTPSLFGKTKRWKAAREVIDWQIPGQSIFSRKRPLKPATMARILAGLEKFGGPELKPFLVVLRNHMAGQSIDGPLPTITAEGGHIGLAEPFLMHITHAGPGDRARSIDDPVATVTTANRGEIGLVEPFVIPQQSSGAPRPVSQPLPTISTAGAISVIEPFIVPFLGERQGQDPRVRSIHDPLQTITTQNPIGLVQPHLVKYNGTALAQSVDEPIDTIPTKDRFALVEPFVIHAAHGTKKGDSEARRAQSLDQPLGTLTGSNRFALVMPQVDGYVLDIRFRMLQPHELSAAMSFPKTYQFAGNRGDQVRQIGNAWAGELAKALCLETLKDYASSARLAAIA